LLDAVFDLWYGTDKTTSIQVADELETTTTATTNLQRITLESNKVYHIDTKVLGGSSSDRGSFHLAGTFYYSSGAVQQGSTTTIHSVQSGSWTVAFSTDGNDVLITVSGVARWVATSAILPISV